MQNSDSQCHTTINDSTLSDPESIYLNFLTYITQQQCVWGIATDHWTFCANALGKAMPIWATASAAQSCCESTWSDSRPQCIPLPLFIQQILPYLKEKHYLVAINQLPTGDAIFIYPERLITELIPVQ